MIGNIGKYMSNYLNNSLVTPNLLASGMADCCDEKGRLNQYVKDSMYNYNTPYERNYEVLSFEETLFVHYLKAIKLFFGDKKKLSNPNLKKENQKKINEIIEFLLIESGNYIDTDKKTITFSEDKFIAKNTDIPFEIAKEMPYVLGYIALKRGFRFEKPREFLSEDERENMNLFISFNHLNKTTDSKMITSVGEKIGIPYQEFLQNSNQTKI